MRVYRSGIPDDLGDVTGAQTSVRSQRSGGGGTDSTANENRQKVPRWACQTVARLKLC